MNPKCSFYGDATLPNYKHTGHFEYGPEVNGIPVYGAVEIPRELWGVGNESQTTRDHEYYRRWDHRHLLPWVSIRSEDKPCGCSRTEGQGSGVALITYTQNFTVLGCWDYTGDIRGNSWSLFWIRGRLSTNEMVAVIKRDFPRIWARITARGMLQIQGGDNSPKPSISLPIVVPKHVYEIPDEFFAKCTEQMISITEDSFVAGESMNTKEMSKSR